MEGGSVSAAAKRWEIWGRWLSDRETVIVRLEPHEKCGNRLALLREQFDLHWDLWIESFPVEHPHRALQRRLGRPPVFPTDDEETLTKTCE